MSDSMGDNKGLAGSFTSIGSTAAAVFSASAGACAGGVCAVGAQAGLSVFAASSSGVSALSAAGSAADNSGVLTWWMKLAIVVLMLSTIYTTIILAPHRRLAILTAMGGVFAVVADLHWMPIGKGGNLLALGVGVTPLILGPLIIKWRDFFAHRYTQNVTQILAGGLAFFAFLYVVYLQIFQGWNPCTLCWVERVGLIGVVLATLTQRPPLAFASSVVGILAVFLQLAEMQHASSVLSGVCSLASRTSCVVAGSQPVGPWPIALDAGILFAVLMLLVHMSWTKSRP